MLQVEPSKRSQFIKWVLDKRGVRFHVAELQKTTGAAKSNISGMLNGNIGVSDNFFRTFVEQYQIADAEVDSYLSSIHRGTISVDEHIAELKRHNAFLEKIIDSSLLNIGASLNAIKEKILSGGELPDEQSDDENPFSGKSKAGSSSGKRGKKISGHT